MARSFLSGVSNHPSYLELHEAYNKATRLIGEPNVMITSTDMFEHIKSQFHIMNRFASKTPISNITGLKFNNATIIASRYAPGRTIEFMVEEEEDQFDRWVAEVRAEHELLAGINGS